MSLDSLGVGLEGDHHTFTNFPEHTTSKEASGRSPSRLGAKAPRVTKSTVKKSCGEHKTVWWKCRSGLALSNPKRSTSLGGGLESIEKNGVLAMEAQARGEGLWLEEEEGVFKALGWG